MNDMIPEKLLNSKKYGRVCPDTVRRIWTECMEKHRKPKDAERAAREALHGITGAFMQPSEQTVCLREMSLWKETGDEQHLQNALACHASTKERLPFDDWNHILNLMLGDLPETVSVLDLACGIDPVYLAARGYTVQGTDISGISVDVINTVGKECGLPCSAVCADLLESNGVPDGTYDVALLFKVLPLLDRMKKGGARSTLERIDSRRIIVSFPTRTLGGRNVGMESHYSEWMHANLPENRSVTRSFSSRNEIYFILDRTEVE